MPVVMVLQGIPTLMGDILSTPYDGQYLKSFDFEADGGIGEGEFTTDLQEAMKFDTMSDALRFYGTVPASRPRRLDGEPNKPLTSTNWEFKEV